VSPPDPIVSFLAEARAAVESVLDRWMPAPQEPGGAGRLAEAMRYSVEAGGKRLRPALALAACRAFGGRDADVLPYACALELVHTYSLIHDDLPAMDDDDLRRGRPTSHRVYGEALAILAGDALHTLAFDVLLAQTADPVLARDLGRELAGAVGFEGMVGGQADDLAAGGAVPEAAQLERIHERKTAALLVAAVRGGGRAGGASPAQLEVLGRYGRALGLAFQVTDDVLDVTGTAADLGKTPGKDAREHKMTYVALEGLEAARQRAASLAAEARDALLDLPGTDLLAGLARHVARRDR
jgi:geranylgeranyl diphosphate synthase type II